MEVMQNLSMCRICLATDVRLCSIARSLRDMYEKLTELTFKTEDGRPLVACYICHARLQNCYRLWTSCLRSEQLLTEMMKNCVLVPQQVPSTNTFRVEPMLHLSLGHVLQDSTECHVKEEAQEIIHGVELHQQNIKDNVTEAQEEQCALIDDNNQCSHLEDPLDIIKEEADDGETEDFKQRRQATEQISIEATSTKLDRNKEAEVKFAEPGSVGARGSNKPNLAALKDTEDTSTYERKIEVIKIEQTETSTKELSTKEPKFDFALNKCENVVSFIVNKVCVKKSTNKTVEQNVSSISSSQSKQFSCDTCNKCFTEKGYLKNHIRIHTGEKAYQCKVCKKCFIQKGDLIKHVRTHTGDKPYQCNVCKKGFTQKVSLQNHIRIHTGDKPFQCNVCKKCFVQKGYLRTHIRTHTGEKPYQCNVCNKSFSVSSHYSKHIRIHKC